MSKKPKSPPKKEHHNLGSVVVPKEDNYGSLQEFYPFRKIEFDFLAKYQESLDLDAASKSVGLTSKQKSAWMDRSTKRGQAMAREMEAIQETWRKALSLNPKAAAAQHVELMEKINEDYDQIPAIHQNKPGMASALLKGSDTSLKATGQFQQERIDSGIRVEINIDLGQEKQEVIIEGEVIDD